MNTEISKHLLIIYFQLQVKPSEAKKVKQEKWESSNYRKYTAKTSDCAKANRLFLRCIYDNCSFPISPVSSSVSRAN